jgi:hypothetical protein
MSSTYKHASRMKLSIVLPAAVFLGLTTLELADICGFPVPQSEKAQLESAILAPSPDRTASR